MFVVFKRKKKAKEAGELASAVFVSVEVDEFWGEAVHGRYGQCECEDMFLLATVRLVEIDLVESRFVGDITAYACLSCDWVVDVE